MRGYVARRIAIQHIHDALIGLFRNLNVYEFIDVALFANSFALRAPRCREMTLLVETYQLKDESQIWRCDPSTVTDMCVRLRVAYVVADHQVCDGDRDRSRHTLVAVDKYPAALLSGLVYHLKARKQYRV